MPVSQDKTYTMMGGGPASGKSSIIRAGLVKLPENHVAIDSDAIKGELPEFHGLRAENDPRGADYVHEESSHLAKDIQAKSFAAGQDVVLDGTGDNSVKSVADKVKKARDAGYKVKAQYTTCSTDEALRRNIIRAYGGQRAREMGYQVNDHEMKQKPEGRLPPEEMLRDVHKGVSQVLPEAVKMGLFDHVQLWDTEHKTNGQPTLVMTAEGTNMTVHHPELYQKFIAKAGPPAAPPAAPAPAPAAVPAATPAAAAAQAAQIKYGVDKTGRAHEGSGPGGGRFTSKAAAEPKTASVPAGKEQGKEETVAKLRQHTTAAAHDPDPYKTAAFDLGPHAGDVQKIKDALKAHEATKSFKRLSISDIAAKLPHLPIEKLHGILGKMHHDKHIRLGPYTQALMTHEKPEHLLPLEREAKFYVGR